MKKDLTDVLLLLDCSGSMSAVQRQTIESVNRLLDDQAKLPGEARVSVARFNDGYGVVESSAPAASATRLDERNYAPSGSTALYDALGRVLSDFWSAEKKIGESERAEKVVLVVVTDGEENASVEYRDLKVLRQLVERFQSAGTAEDPQRREVLFLAANLDGFALARQTGVSSAHVMNYAPSPAGTAGAVRSAGSAIADFRSPVGSGQACFTAADRADAEVHLAAVGSPYSASPPEDRTGSPAPSPFSADQTNGGKPAVKGQPDQPPSAGVSK